MYFILLSCFFFLLMLILSYIDLDFVFGVVGVFVRWLRIVIIGLFSYFYVLYGFFGVGGGRGYFI